MSLLELQPFELVDDGEVPIGAFATRVLDRSLTRAEEASPAAGSLADHPVTCRVASQQEERCGGGRQLAEGYFAAVTLNFAVATSLSPE